MKNYIRLLLFSLLLGNLSMHGQELITKDSLSTSYMVSFDQTVNFEDYQVTFKKLLSDSRCPKDVTCNRAGEAKVLLSIFKKGTFIADKEVIIDASGYALEANNLAYDDGDFKIYGMALQPYPMASVQVAEKNYLLEIMFQPKQL